MAAEESKVDMSNPMSNPQEVALDFMRQDPKFLAWTIAFLTALQKHQNVVYDDYDFGSEYCVHTVTLSRYEKKDGTISMRQGDVSESRHDYAWISMWNTYGNPLYLSSNDDRIHLSTCVSGKAHFNTLKNSSSYRPYVKPVTWHVTDEDKDTCAWGATQRFVALSVVELQTLVEKLTRK